jgi:MFS family permease
MQDRARPSGWYYGWNIVGGLVLSQLAANVLSYNCFPQFIPIWAAEMHAKPSAFQLAILAMIVVAAPSSVVVGAWADKYPARRLFGAGLIGIALFYLAVSFATRPIHIVAAFAVICAPSLALAASIPANAVISRWFRRRLGIALGISTCGVGIGAAIIPKLLAVAIPELGWRMVWRLGALIVAVVVLPIVLALVRDKPSAKDDGWYLSGDGAAVSAHGHGGRASGGNLTWRDILARRTFWLLVAIYLVMIGSGTAFIQNMAVLAGDHHIGIEGTSSMISAVGIAHVFAALVMGALSDRFGYRVPLAGMALIVVVGIGILGFGESLPVLILGAGLIGLNAAVFTPLSAAIADEFGPADFGKVFGMLMLFLPGSQIFPFFVARVHEATGSYLTPMAICAGLLVVISGLSLLLRGRSKVEVVAPLAEPSVL